MEEVKSVKVEHSDWVDWKMHPVTEAVFVSIRVKIRELEEDLGRTAGLDVSRDRYICGIIEAYKSVLTTDLVEDEGYAS